MGPWPPSGAFQQHLAICEPCGFTLNYRMAVDVTYGDGPSERGFGLVVRWNEDHLLTAEVTPWQTTDSWLYDYRLDQWTWINGLVTGAVRPGRQTNRVEVRVESAAAFGRSDVTVTVNGRNVLVLFNQPGEPGLVGLTLFGHAVEAIFDDFEFEELPPYQIRERPPGPMGFFVPIGS